MSNEPIHLMDPRTLDAAELVKWLRAFFILKPKAGPHWTAVSTALGRVTDERLYGLYVETVYANEEAWAKDVLGLTRVEMRLALKLYRAISRHPSAPWAELSKPKALLLDEVLTAGGDVTEWSVKAMGSTTKEFEHAVRRQLKEDVFLTLTIRYPESMKELVEEAMRRAVYYGLNDPLERLDPAPHTAWPGGAVDPDRWRSAAVVFRAFEVLCVSFVQTTEPIPTTTIATAQNP